MCKRYAIYARQSIDKADSISIETQIERCLFEVGDAPYQVYSDRGYSGKNTDRPQFQQLLKDLRTGEISCVVCYKLDRCSRSILDFTQLMNLFQQYDVAFISCTEKFDTATPMGRAMLNICIVFAQLERETIQQRITDAYHSRCKKGYFMGGRVPFGFSLEPYWLDGKKTSCYQTVPEEAEILKQIYSLYRDPSASLSDVVLTLRERGITNPRRPDGIWVRTHLARLIRNPIYVMADERIYDYFVGLNAIPDNSREDFTGHNGCYLYRIGNEQHLVLAPHGGIVSSEIWLQCQRNRTNSNRIKSKTDPASWLNGILMCQKCGRAVVTRRTVGHNGKTYRYFLCSGSRGKDWICDGFKPFPAQTLEDAMEKAIIHRIGMLSHGQNTGATASDQEKLLRELLARLEASQPVIGPDIDQLKQTLLRLCPPLVPPPGSTPELPQKDPEQWDQLTASLSRWKDIPQSKKSEIAKLLIGSVKLTDTRVTICWRV